jgi:serine/threonine protein kinase
VEGYFYFHLPFLLLSHLQSYPKIGLLVAVKYIYKKDENDGTQYEETFKKEIAMLSSLRHPNIINFIGWSWVSEAEEGGGREAGEEGEEGGREGGGRLISEVSRVSSLVMVTEFMGGGTLDHMVKHSYSFLSSNVFVISSIIVDVLCGMTYLHERNILHRYFFFGVLTWRIT